MTYLEEQAVIAYRHQVKEAELGEQRYWERFCYYRDKGWYQTKAKCAAAEDLHDYYEDRHKVMGMDRKELNDYCYGDGYALEQIPIQIRKAIERRNNNERRQRMA